MSVSENISCYSEARQTNNREEEMSTQDPPATMATSRTYQYRKVMKPLLERKRRARINKCLDELKHLIMDIVQMDPDTLAKLEKADILELTVHHLHRQRSQFVAVSNNSHSTQQQHQQQLRIMERYWCGFQQCAVEVSQFLQRHDNQINLKFLKAFEQFMPSLPLRIWRPW